MTDDPPETVGDGVPQWRVVAEKEVAACEQ